MFVVMIVILLFLIHNSLSFKLASDAFLGFSLTDVSSLPSQPPRKITQKTQ
jgi:hypothetical protein